MILRAPFPWFGGKRRVAHVVWERFGDVPNYVEPFAGSLAVLLARPHEPRVETANDLDCYVANFWRALQAAPDEVARWADWPVNEADLHARHQWLVDRVDFRERMKTDPDLYDAKIAGWWAWGISQWIGAGWCRDAHTRGQFGGGLTNDKGLHAKRPRLGRGGRGVSRQIPELRGDSGAVGKGVVASAKLAEPDGVAGWLRELAARLRRVRVCCGDWKRITGLSPTTCIGTTAMFLDPPYGAEDRSECYSVDDFEVASQVRAWCIERGDDPALRIALCGYEGEHNELVERGWTVVAWKAHGGYGRSEQAMTNGERERIWFSPHCLAPALVDRQESLFA